MLLHLFCHLERPHCHHVFILCLWLNWTYLKQSGSYNLIPAEFLRSARLLFQWLSKKREISAFNFSPPPHNLDWGPVLWPKKLSRMSILMITGQMLGYLLNPTILSGTLKSSVVKALREIGTWSIFCPSARDILYTSKEIMLKLLGLQLMTVFYTINRITSEIWGTSCESITGHIIYFILFCLRL